MCLTWQFDWQKSHVGLVKTSLKLINNFTIWFSYQILVYKINFQIPYNSIVDLYTKFRSNSKHKQTHTTQHTQLINYNPQSSQPLQWSNWTVRFEATTKKTNWFIFLDRSVQFKKKKKKHSDLTWALDHHS